MNDKSLIRRLLRENLNEVTDDVYKLIEAKYPNARLIMNKHESIEYKPTPHQDYHFKPNGLWYGFGTSWVDWVRDSMPEWEHDHVHLVDINTDRILRINDYKELREFDNAYVIKELSDSTINWPSVAEKYDGIEIVPYIDQARFNFSWYYPWDVASGCVWGNAVRDITKIS